MRITKPLHPSGSYLSVVITIQVGFLPFSTLDFFRFPLSAKCQSLICDYFECAYRQYFFSAIFTDFLFFGTDTPLA